MTPPTCCDVLVWFNFGGQTGVKRRSALSAQTLDAPETLGFRCGAEGIRTPDPLDANSVQGIAIDSRKP
jgi:hypothetical protein